MGDAVGGCGAYYSRNANNRETRVCYQKDHDDKRCTASEALKCAAPKPSPSPPAAPPPPPDTSVAPAITTRRPFNRESHRQTSRLAAWRRASVVASASATRWTSLSPRAPSTP